MIKPGDLVTALRVGQVAGAKGIWLFDKPPDQQFKIHIANLKRGEAGLAVVVLNKWLNSHVERHVHCVFVIAHDGVGWTTADMLEAL